MLLTESKLISPKNSNNYWTYHDPIESVEYIPAWRFFCFQFHDFDVDQFFVRVLQSPNIFWQFRFISSVRASKGGLMVSVPFLKVCCQSDVSFSCRRCGYSGLVDYIWLETFSFEWTIWFLSAIAGVRLLRWWVEIWKNVLVVWRDDRFHVRHAWVAQF